MTALNLNASDAAALAFYEAHRSYVEGFGLANLDREDRLEFRKGKKVLEALHVATKAALNPRSKEATRWTPEEYAVLAAAYIRNGADERACLADFRLYSERHSDYAVRLAVNSCKFLDTTVKDAKGLHDYANGLLGALQDIAGDRFQGRR
tara:strand:+ start:223 stop:672 length:450 start_codon:yes stop_codon:yes gene_type:complete